MGLSFWAQGVEVQLDSRFQVSDMGLLLGASWVVICRVMRRVALFLTPNSRP